MRESAEKGAGLPRQVGAEFHQQAAPQGHAAFGRRREMKPDVIRVEVSLVEEISKKCEGHPGQVGQGAQFQEQAARLRLRRC